MRVIVFGATGMLGQGVLRACLADDRVTAVLAVGRSPTGRTHPKLREIRHADLFDLTPVAGDLAGYDACFFCVGVSSAGMGEREYRRLTYDLTLSVARTLAGLSPGSTFVYVSGIGTDARSRTMWARVKGETENALLALPLEVYLFRPGYVQPMYGATSRTRLYRLAYVVAAPFYPVLRRLFPSAVTTTEQIGRAMIAVAERGAPGRVLDAAAVNAL
ncbi:epimerase [Nonomuraea sp. MCN248]|uniref:Epimerase n=1 Tax=Nonomuraea corallina TaxID=2989783 RepID=A0ABT4SMB3_9ACTN|nr:epimerase [Nonomuraea corallina]MDA0638148.1 epimerase [Nonomuraea corallina]